MKKIFRMIIFSAIAIYLTSLWNFGFKINYSWNIFLKATLAIAIIYYLIVPLSKLILFPLNLLTLGLMSFLLYLFTLHLLSSGFHLINITSWQFPGINFLSFSIPKMEVNYFFNLILSAMSVSLIINFLEQLI
ncbi:MAG: phage holin family protein [Microgenomates group bacterium]|nr:phage holin family protein [Microgenomates group bacterium]